MELMDSSAKKQGKLDKSPTIQGSIPALLYSYKSAEPQPQNNLEDDYGPVADH